MRTNIIALASFMVALLPTTFCQAQEDDWGHIDWSKVISSDTIKKGKYTLVFINMQVGFDAMVKQRLIDAYFQTYPAEAKMFNKKVPHKVLFVIDPAYKGVAATSNGLVRFNPEWFAKKPGDIDVVTHEVMHFVQAYPDNTGPGWITEGIADYVRYILGVDNAGAGWTLPDLKPEHNYDNAYRITARFFVWLEKTRKKGLIKKLDKAMREATYSDAFWIKNTGMELGDLWKAYSLDPAI